MKKNASHLKYAAFVTVLLASAGCSDDSAKGVALNCETGLVVCGNQCCDGTCENGVCKTNGGGSGDEDGICPKGLSECRGACVDYKASHNNCGSCGNACDDNEVCVEGDCKPNACPTGMEICNGACINKKIDAENCGACGNVCGGNAYCADSACQCPQGYSDCDHNMANGCEAATLKCDSLCDDASQVKCDGGACCDNASECCGSACCGEGTTCCGDGICADVQSDAANCGTCGNACTDGKSCVDGNCERVCSGATPDKCEALDVCVNFASDVLHCGNCDTKCATTETCVEGVCTPSEVNCSDDPDADATTLCWGTCVDLDSDAQNCGTCGNACLADQACEAGTCVCPPDTQVCEGKCVDYASDKNHCGSCGNACLADQTCEESTCVCPEGTGVCGDKCLDFSSDKNNCGSCGHACVGDEICEEGACKLVCANASDIVCNGICVDPQTSNTYCGNCDTKCATTETCVEGVCTPSEVDCSADGDDPDATPKTLCWGVCTDLSSDKANCGACGEACVEGQNCVEGACVCPSETTLCNGKCISFTSDAANCGACGRACGDKQICASGECVASEVITCFGKETDLKSDVNNCGACLHKCSTGEACEDGVCTLVCGEGYTLCNGACINLLSSAANCGACGHACKDGESCDASLCNCSAGRFDCDGDASNGCESTSKCACEPGSKQACWRGAAENRHVGACKEDGEQICDATGQFWGPCIGGIYPSAITCDDKGLFIGGDQNCNGIADETEECITKCDMTLSDSSYIGCEYWAAYTHNVSTSGWYSVILSNMGDYDADVNVYYGSNDNVVFSGTIRKGTVQTVQLSSYNRNSAMLAINVSQPQTVLQKKGFRIVSTQPITAYQFNPLRDGALYNDALLLLPKNVFGKKYYNIIGSTTGTNTYYTSYTYMAVQATSPGKTTFKIKSNIDTITGTNSKNNSTIEKMIANKEYPYELEQFDVFEIMANGSMTGTEVTADKPFVAIAGCPGCYNAVKMGSDVQDHYSEQLFPYQSWGSEYAIVGFQKQNSERDQWRIFAAEDTQLIITPSISTQNHGTIGGSTPIPLKAGQYYDIVTSANFHLKSPKPILVAGFLGDEGTSKDPSYMLVVPVQQFRSDYSFMVPEKYNINYLTLIAPSDIASVKIYKTGSATALYDLNNSNFTKINGTNYSYYRLDMGKATAAYKLVADKPIGVQSYGYYGATSYAYPLGLNLTKLNTN